MCVLLLVVVSKGGLGKLRASTAIDSLLVAVAAQFVVTNSCTAVYWQALLSRLPVLLPVLNAHRITI